MIRESYLIIIRLNLSNLSIAISIIILIMSRLGRKRVAEREIQHTASKTLLPINKGAMRLTAILLALASRNGRCQLDTFSLILKDVYEAWRPGATTLLPTGSPRTFPLGRCSGEVLQGVQGVDWPIFHNSTELENNVEWATYFRLVYGFSSPPNTSFPLCTTSLTLVYLKALADAGLKMKPTACDYATNLPETGFVSQMSTCCPPPAGVAAFVWNLHNVRREVPSHHWVEVFHVKEANESGVAWYYLMRGSAVWWNVGNTKVYHDHSDAARSLLPSELGLAEDCTDPQCEALFAHMFKAARRNWESIQFTNHYDCACGTRGPLHGAFENSTICQTEIVDLRGKGADGCGGRTYKTGWDATEECHCESSLGYSNCNGYPHAGQPVLQGLARGTYRNAPYRDAPYEKGSLVSARTTTALLFLLSALLALCRPPVLRIRE